MNWLDILTTTKIKNCIDKGNTLRVFIGNTVIDIIPRYLNDRYLIGRDVSSTSDVFEYHFRIENINAIGFLIQNKGE